MKAVPTLIKLAQQRVDQQRLRTVKLQNIHDDLTQQLHLMEQNLIDEANKARNDPILSMHYGRYAHTMENRTKSLQDKINANQKRLKQEQDHLATLFKEQKSLEVYQANHQARLQKQQDKRQQDTIDEVATQQHQRKVKKM